MNGSERQWSGLGTIVAEPSVAELAIPALTKKAFRAKQNAFLNDSNQARSDSISVVLGLVWALNRDTNIVRLLRRQLR
jgi:hypothetical protein